MNEIKCVVFDLDGTLVQSAETIYLATIKALDQLNIAYDMPRAKFDTMIGWHFEDIFNEVGITLNDFEEFITLYKSHYLEFIDKSSLYENVPEILEILKDKNIRIALLTTKAQDQADLNIKYLKLDKYFDIVMGRRPGIAHKPSPQQLEMICESLNVNAQETLMVGDSEMDIQCGKNANSFTCGVTYGYRTTEVLKNENPTFLINNLIELKKIIDNHY